MNTGLKLVNPLSANPIKWLNTLKQFVNCVNVLDHFIGLALKGLRKVFAKKELLASKSISQSNPITHGLFSSTF